MKPRVFFLSFFSVFVGIFFLAGTVTHYLSPASASSLQAYQDYQFTFDNYRNALNQLNVTKNEYLKFQTIAAESALFAAAKEFMMKRADLASTYLFLLNEKLNEDRGLKEADKAGYQTAIQREATFLANHKERIGSVSTLQEAQLVGSDFTKHQDALEIVFRQSALAVSLGAIQDIAGHFDSAVVLAGEVIADPSNNFSPQRRSLFDRSMLSITNTQSLAQQALDRVAKSTTTLQGHGTDLDRKEAVIQQDLDAAEKEVANGVGFLVELLTNLRYQ